MGKSYVSLPITRLYITVTTNQILTNLREELRLTDQSFARLAQILNMTIIMIHFNFVATSILFYYD